MAQQLACAKKGPPKFTLIAWTPPALTRQVKMGTIWFMVTTITVIDGCDRHGRVWGGSERTRRWITGANDTFNSRVVRCDNQGFPGLANGRAGNL